MGLFEKLKLLFKVRRPLTDLIVEVKEVKGGFKTVGFWVSVLATLLSLAAALKGMVPVTASLVITTVIAACYNILRGATKANAPATKPLFQTSEFWLSVLTEIGNAFTALKTGGVNPAWMTTASGAVATCLAMGQNLAAQTPSAPPVKA